MQNVDLVLQESSQASSTPLMAYDNGLVEVMSFAASRFYAQLDREAPFLASEVREWVKSLYKSIPLADAFRLPSAFPMLLLPWALEESIRVVPDAEFQRDLVFSSINGYHYIRLIDNVMDGDGPQPHELLPVLGVFYFYAHTSYHRYFPHDHPFWDTFKACWFRCADVTGRDAKLGEFDRALFVGVAGQKTCAGKIPLAAVCAKYDRAELFEPWSHFHDILGCWHQMTNDLRDWQTDLTHHTATYFLSEAARRKQDNESVAEWVVREGYAWAVGLLADWMAEMKVAAAPLGSPALLAYLDARERLQAERHAPSLEVLQQVAQLLARLKTRHGE